MAINTQMMNGVEVKEAGAPEGYKFTKDEKGRISLKKIRSKVEKKVEEVKKTLKKVKGGKK